MKVFHHVLVLLKYGDENSKNGTNLMTSHFGTLTDNVIAQESLGSPSISDLVHVTVDVSVS